jgi:hypothetical protein
MSGWEGGNEVGSPKSGYRLGCARPVVVAMVCDRRANGQLLRQEKDEASRVELSFARIR